MKRIQNFSKIMTEFVHKMENEETTRMRNPIMDLSDLDNKPMSMHKRLVLEMKKRQNEMEEREVEVRVIDVAGRNASEIRKRKYTEVS